MFSTHLKTFAGAPLLRGALLAALALPAAGCIRDPLDAGSVWRDDYRDRHPIELANVEQTLDIFAGANSGVLDPRQRDDVNAFARDYLANGKGPLIAYVPVGKHGYAGHAGLGAVKQALGNAGLGGHGLTIQSYKAPHDGTAHPIRLVFTKLKARVATACEEFPQDVIDGSSFRGAKNRDYYAFGCSYQNNLASQVADPRDLQRGRQETRPDTARQIAIIEKRRNGIDPSTDWKAKPTTINTTVGGGG